jgi:hypothetical protein
MVEWLGDYQPTKSKLWTPSAYRGIARSACAHQIIGIVEWGSAMSALKAPRELAQRMRARKLGQDDDGFVWETFCQPRDDARAAARASSIGAPRLPTCRTSKADGSCLHDATAADGGLMTPLAAARSSCTALAAFGVIWH